LPKSITALRHPSWVPPSSASARFGGLAKRGIDLAIACLALIALSPVMVVIAVLIRVTMGPGVVSPHARVGLNGQTFKCLKFRTMIGNSDRVLAEYLRNNLDARHEWDATQKLRDDPRVTTIGRFLRRSSLDELPQLINVLRGDMSCVGPRPVVQAELPRYGVHMVDYLSVRPGLTGLWQVSGRSRLSYADRVTMDADYVHHWSLRLDLFILLRTIPAVAKFEEAA